MSALTDSIRKRFIQSLNEVRDEHRDMRSNIKLAKRLRTQPPRISEWERGIGNPTVEHIYYLCKEFNKSAAFIITGEKSKENITSEFLNVVRRVERLEKLVEVRRKTA